MAATSCFQFIWIYIQKWDCWINGISVFSFLRKLHTVFGSSCTILQSQLPKGPTSPHLYQHLLFSVFTPPRILPPPPLLAILMGVIWPFVILICNSLMISDVEHFFMFAGHLFVCSLLAYENMTDFCILQLC